MDRHKIHATTVRLEPEDRQAIDKIKQIYGCTSDNAAIKLALRMLARRETPAQPARKEDFLLPMSECQGFPKVDV